MTVERLQLNVINTAWLNSPSGAIGDIDEAIADADGNTYGGTSNGGNSADFGCTDSAVVDSDIVSEITFEIRIRDTGTAGNLFVDVDLLIGGVVQGTAVRQAVTSTMTNYTITADSGWQADRTAAEMDGMELRLTPENTGMPGSSVPILDCAEAIVTYTSPTQTLNQTKFAFHEDGTEAAAGFVYEMFENVGVVRNHTISADRDLLLRVQIQESTGLGGASTDDWKVQSQKNGTGGYADTTTTSNNVIVWTGSALTDGGASTNRLSAGSGSHVAGEQEEANGIVEDWNLTANNFGELVFAIQLVEADLASGDYIEFRIMYDGGGGYAVLDSYDQTPIIHCTTGPVIRGITSGNFGTFNDTSIVTTPAGTVQDDLMLVQCVIDNSGGSDSWDAQTDWTTLYDSDLQTVLLGCFYRQAPVSPASTYTFTAGTLATNEDDCWIFYRIDGHDTADQIDTNSINDSGADTDPVSSAVTTTRANDLILSITAQPSADLTADINPPTGTLTWAASNAPDGSGVESNSTSLGIGAHSVKATAATTGTASHSNSFTDSSNGWQAIMVAIQAEAAAGGDGTDMSWPMTTTPIQTPTQVVGY